MDVVIHFANIVKVAVAHLDEVVGKIGSEENIKINN
jgi:hypothetical protein